MSTPADFLAALVAFLAAESHVVATFGAKVYLRRAGADVDPPYLILWDYREHPTTSVEDQPISLSVRVVTNDSEDAARAAGVVVKNVLDTQLYNPNAYTRDPLTWSTGKEVWVRRNDTGTGPVPGIGKGGRYVFVEDIDYEFMCEPIVP